MATFSKFQPFVEQLAEKVYNLGSDTLRLALTNTAPVNTQTNWNTTDHPAPAAANGYTAGGNTLTVTTSSQTSGTYTLACNQSVFTAAGGSIGPFRYVIMYDDTATNNEIIGWWDYASSITLLDGETFTWKPNNANPGTVLTIGP